MPFHGPHSLVSGCIWSQGVCEDAVHCSGFVAMRCSPRCIIALGLDKKPTPPPKRLQRDTDTAGRSLQMTGVTRKAEAEDSAQHTQPHPGAQSSQVQPDQAVATEAGQDHPEEDKKAQDGRVKQWRHQHKYCHSVWGCVKLNVHLGICLFFWVFLNLLLNIF